MRALIALLTILAIATRAHPTNPCQQEFELLGKTTGEPSVLRFIEHRFGACEMKINVSLYLTGERPAVVMDYKSYWTDSLFKARSHEEPVRIDVHHGIAGIDDSITVHAPEADSATAELWKHYIQTGGYEPTYFVDCTTNCIDEPLFDGAEFEPVYIHPSGFYKNYSLARLFYYPKSGYLVILTHQPTEFYYQNTLHGLLVYKLEDDDE